MRNKTYKYLAALCVGTMLFCSCSNDEELDSNIIVQENSNNEKGRFDDVPFKWDYTYSTDSDKNEKQIFIGDLAFVGNDESQEIGTRSAADRYGYSRPGGSTSRPSRPSTGGGDGYRKEDIFITNPIPVYLGGAYLEKEFGKSFKPEILYPRNPVDVIFNFTRPYFGEITKENGSIGCKRLLSEALDSKEYMQYLKGGAKESFEFNCSEYFSYSDIEKAISANAGLAKIFSTKIRNNTKSVNVKSRLLGQLISKNFTVSIDIPVNGFFKDKSKDTSAENPVYVYSITYGKVAFLSVESEYSFEEVKTAVEAGINYKIFSAGGSYSKHQQEIIAKSRITLFIIADDDPNGHTFYTMDNIKNSFNLSYSIYNPGYPIFCQGNYTKDNSAFYLKSDAGGRRRGSYSTPGEYRNRGDRSGRITRRRE